jgi:folate-binding protein YgfZ
LSGKDRVKFLNNFCTADLKRLVPGKTQELMLLNAKGQILSWGSVWDSDAGLVLMLSGQSADEVIKHLDAYLFSEDVRMMELPTKAWLMAATPRDPDPTKPTLADRNREPLCGEFVAGTCNDGLASEVAWCVWQAPRNARWLITSGNIDGAEVSSAFAPWRTAISGDRVWKCGSLADYHRWRIDACIPIVTQDTTANSLPQELLRDDLAISFTKGCYLGQETVARLDAMGHINWNLSTVTLDADWPNDLTNQTSSAPIQELTIRTSQQTLGQLTSICGNKAIARLRASAVEEFRRTGGGDWQLYLHETPMPHKLSQIV